MASMFIIDGYLNVYRLTDYDLILITILLPDGLGITTCFDTGSHRIFAWKVTVINFV